MEPLQRLGRSLMLPIASLPVAALMMRAGQPDLLGRWPDITWLHWLAQILNGAGSAVFEHLPILFAVGVAIGFAKKSDGSTAIAAIVGYVTLNGIFQSMSPIILDGRYDAQGEQEVINYGVLAGLIMGIVTALLWQRYRRTILPDWLGFFNGKRFVPLLVGFAAVLISIPMMLLYPAFDHGLTWTSESMNNNLVLGGFAYGFFNRMLIPLGLHHILNFFPWFVLGDYSTEDGVVHGDIARFLAGDPSAGTFMTGFFPIMMFALPAACLAIYHTARPAQRKITGGAMLSLALTAFLTGITEPIEFSFMFLAFPLYVLHAVLTGISMAVVNFFGLRSGFGFSAGTADFLLNYGIAEKPLMIILVGLIFGVIYYVIFRTVIIRFDLKTPGRIPAEDPIPDENSTDSQQNVTTVSENTGNNGD